MKKYCHKYPLVSVAIITYNQKKFLKEAIKSVLIQDYNNIEIIVSDDNSNDGTKELLMAYQETYGDKFKVALGEKNLGVTGNSNRAFYKCQGEYICWLGGDDLMLQGKIKKQVALMQKVKNCSIVYHNLEVFQSDTGSTLYEFNRKNKPREGSISVLLKYGCFLGASSVMVRRSMMPNSGFLESLSVASDFYCWINVLENGGVICYLPEILGRYRRHTNNVTSISKYDCFLDYTKICNSLILKYPDYFKYILKIYAQAYRNLRNICANDYIFILMRSLIFEFSYKAIGGIIIYIFSFGKIRK